MIEVKFKKLYPDSRIPLQGTEKSVGYDLHAYLLTERNAPSKTIIPAQSTRNIPTGISIEPPPDCFAVVCSRSGIAKASLSVCNSPGVIDPDYRGEVCVLLHNGGHEWQTIHHEDRIAQLLFFPVTYVTLVEALELSETERGSKGFGSTGR